MRTNIVVLALVGVAVLASSASATTVLFDNGNPYSVFNPPGSSPVLPQFTISDSYLITYVQTYHWNNYYGMSFVGQLALRNVSDNALYGWWQATGVPGMYNVPNAYWTVVPNVVIPAGTYQVLDSYPSTWSQNAMGSGVGFSIVTGTIAQASPPVPEPLTMTALFLSIGGLGAYIRRRRRA